MLDHKLNIDTYVYEFECITIYEFTIVISPNVSLILAIIEINYKFGNFHVNLYLEPPLRHDYQEYKNLPSFLKVKSFSKHSSNLKPNFLTR